MKRLFFFFSCFFLFFSGILFAENVVSDYTLQKVEDFVSYRVVLKSEKDEFAYKTIQKLKEDALSELPKHAIDFEQEECILESLYLTEFYEHSLTASGNQKELRTQMKIQMKKNMACIEKRTQSQISDWLYQFTADVTSYYMTRSVAATFFYGLRVKGYYEKALEVNKKRASSYVCLGNWCFYAPVLFGGGKKKALKHFENALACAELGGEKYLAYISMSQINYENENKEAAKEYLEKAIALGLGRKDLDLIARCNEKGYSYFQYLRNRSGIDEEMAEDEKDEEDK